VGAAIRLSPNQHVSLVRRTPDQSLPRLTVARIDMQRVALVISAPTATRLELMADFTDWQPVSLDRAGSGWRLERAISAGLHQVSLRIDGGPWIAPSNLPRADASAEAGVGLLTVP
jgi:hypothetical protein